MSKSPYQKTVIWSFEVLGLEFEIAYLSKNLVEVKEPYANYNRFSLHLEKNGKWRFEGVLEDNYFDHEEDIIEEIENHFNEHGLPSETD